ncbi:trehalase family glycosidase [uncultured Croceitalea sp.]|uniref:trehalase family glycosidase n=1 Tax=uncultured Croceitalea sp. TaxID=1798908 RepID=UPI00374FCCD8
MIFKLPIEEILNKLLLQEDTDKDKKITKEDKGPKNFKITSEDGKDYEVKGTYFLSNLLQELALEKNLGKTIAVIPLDRIEEVPSARISRMIRDYFWDELTRTIDEKGLDAILSDDKTSEGIQRLYVPHDDEIGKDYFNTIQKLKENVKVEILPKTITPEFVKSINTKPGILSLKLENEKGVPFVVPGGRFNEMYGWDSYFEGVGLLLDGSVSLAKAMVDNFCYQIKHYGKILNANRSYYLTRTQPPFLSSFIREVYEADTSIGLDWLASVLDVAILEYNSVWMVPEKRLTANGLNRYLAEGIGIPPETESGHFNEVLTEYAEKHKLSLKEFEEKYTSGELIDNDLDTYFIHDRSLRESGHDTSWRLDDCCADLNTVDLNSLLYKYEIDFEHLISTYFNDEFVDSKGSKTTTAFWSNSAEERKKLMNSFLWSANDESFFDYNVALGKHTNFESATNFYPLWAQLCSKEQAYLLVKKLCADFKAKGGVLATTKAAIEELAKDKEQKQWDYPNGWAPHQMLIWKGLLNYGFEGVAHEFIYRWLWMITRNAVDYNGTIPEKYDVVACTHKVYAEYGNVGTEFDYIATSGFGWMNASYQYGLSLLPKNLIVSLDKLEDPDTLFSKT